MGYYISVNDLEKRWMATKKEADKEAKRLRLEGYGIKLYSDKRVPKRFFK